MPLFLCINFSGSNLWLVVQMSLPSSVDQWVLLGQIWDLIGGVKVGN
jgi:hypothetical protein